MSIRNVSLLILYNSEGRILLQHRAKDAVRLPDYWGFFGGGIEQGESPEQALKREILEELNYKTENSKLLTTLKFSYKGDENTKYVFIEKYDEKIPLTLGEGQGMEWFFPEETKKLKIVDHDLPVIAEINKYLTLLNN